MSKGAHDERYQTLIAQLRAARINARVSQADLAAKLGTRQQFVSKYESGERRLDVVEFADAARALGVDPASLLNEIPTNQSGQS